MIEAILFIAKWVIAIWLGLFTGVVALALGLLALAGVIGLLVVALDWTGSAKFKVERRKIDDSAPPTNP